MNKDRRAVVIHDVASLLFLAPFSACVADVFFSYKVYCF